MSDREAIPPAEGVDDFPNLYPRQTGLGVYRVLHIKEDDTSTHYKVNINDGECECQDFTHRGGDGKACKHLSAALYQAQKHISAEDVAVNNLVGVVRDARDSASELERIATGVKADISHAAAESPSDDADNEPDVDPVEGVQSWLNSRGAPVEKLKVWKDDQFGSIQIDTDGYLEDDEFQAYRDAVDHDAVNYDKDNGVNFIKSENIAEVV